MTLQSTEIHFTSMNGNQNNINYSSKAKEIEKRENYLNQQEPSLPKP